VCFFAFFDSRVERSIIETFQKRLDIVGQLATKSVGRSRPERLFPRSTPRVDILASGVWGFGSLVQGFGSIGASGDFGKFETFEGPWRGFLDPL
jgi:hypothetical protein